MAWTLAGGVGGSGSERLRPGAYFTLKVSHFDVVFFHGAWPW